MARIGLLSILWLLFAKDCTDIIRIPWEGPVLVNKLAESVAVEKTLMNWWFF